jgi:hypothetical protein
MTRPLSPLDGSQLLEKSAFYQAHLAEVDEILRHKWIESEKAGRDIGFEKALIHWKYNHYTQWRKARLSPKAVS